MKKLCATAIALILSAPAMALDLNGNFYVAGEGGLTTLDTSGISYDMFNTGKFGYTLRGGYRIPFNQNFSLGLEAGYINLGSTSATSTAIMPTITYTSTQKLSQYGGDVLGVATYTFNNGFNIFGKAGGAYIKQKIDLNSVQVDSESAIKPEIAAGLGYQLNQHLALTGTVSHIFSSNDNVIENSTSLLAGLKVNF